MELINNIIQSSTFPLLTAFVLGLLTIISPCPFCSDITAVSYIGKDVSSKATIIKNGVLYAMGKIVAYFGLSFVFIFGGEIEPVQHILEEYGEKMLGPFFIVCAILIGIFSYFEKHHHVSQCGNDHHCHCGDEKGCHCGEYHHHHQSQWFSHVLSIIPKKTHIGAFFIGLLGSLAFCPYTGVLYFGILIPLTISQSTVWSWMLPFTFAFATAIPVLLITMLFAYGVKNISRINAHIHKIEIYLRVLCISIFLGVGIYLTITTIEGHSHHHHYHQIEKIQINV